MVGVEAPLSRRCRAAANVPYMPYFLAYVLQFQFQRSWCRAAGRTGPLYRCSVYGNRAAGQTDGTAIVDYFQPLVVWLERQNQGKPVGW